MTTITKERLLTIKQWRETYGPGSNVVLPAEEAEELARIALASLEAVSDERAAYELFMEKRFGESVDRRRAKNGDREYMAWDMALGWIIWCHRAAMLQGIQPVSQAYNLPELIEGMEVSIDVSTCDADLGNRYFGTVTEALELDTAKNGYILLVQDAEPNFDVNGNSPVTPDGWISCSERMPKETGDIIVVSDGIVMSGISYSRRDGFYIAALEYDDDEPIGGVTHWMPLPEPPRLKEL
ncbi:DUF551 domain-containing protein [Escherichia coli]|uniref:DUF551 domain-containing protein n=1 Tax=Escherichia coli TaxID=562 RepID=UPI001841B9E3|nr:DUF551 domain-containing protein [Escherichia coli]EFH1952384.1 DUF551 domain-containing protein [Escherichia coli]EHH5933102.1 DUF551 domain-containing protein [Escherichia coli]EIF7379872.1 DUF551 domain-containing protein [Escherichia coli]EKN2752323.1 DUF551 domain-containing protein [Escherichia coli]